MVKHLMLAAGFITTTALSLSAIPAKRGTHLVTQPDGTQIEVITIGDEHRHLTLTSDSIPLVSDADGYLCYAETDGSPAMRATAIASRPSQVTEWLAARDNRALRRSMMESKTPARVRRIAESGVGLYDHSYPVTGDIKALVILVNYKDVKFTTTNPLDYFSRLLNEPGFSSNGGTGSARDYFLDASCEQFRPQFDVYGPVTLSQNRSYYGGNDYYGDDKNPEEMIVEGIKALDSQVDFSQYDMNHDGYLDNVYVFYAGEGEADGGSSSTVWPHSWQLSYAGKSFKVDGVTVDRYACSNEIIYYTSGSKGPDGIGTFVHEFSHVMGLPDLYDTESSHYETPCGWDVMDYGPYNNNSRTPPTYSAYERNAMGWIEPEVIDGPLNGTLQYIGDSNTCYIIPTGDSNEFFLLENRQQKGWDKYVPGHGMLIWHIQFKQSVWDSNTVNNTRSHQYVDIEEAANKRDGQSASTMASYPFPGTKGITSFTDDTTPSMKTWAGKKLELPLTEIAESAGVITFKVAGGQTAVATPEVLEADDITADGFTARWNATEGATDYLLTVSTDLPGEQTTEYTGFGTGTSLTIPAGWSLSRNASYLTDDYVGQSRPAVKFDRDGATLTTCEFSEDVNSVSFWYRGASTNNSGSTLTLSGATESDGSFAEILRINPLVYNAGTTVEVKDIPVGIRVLRWTFTKETGNCALDDINIVLGENANSVVAGYDGVSTGGATSMYVTGLPEVVRKFRYSVVATDGTEQSKPSGFARVYLPESSGVYAPAAEAACRVAGREIIVGAPADARVEIVDVSGRVLMSTLGSAALTVNQGGVYIVCVGDTVRKVIVK